MKSSKGFKGSKYAKPDNLREYQRVLISELLSANSYQRTPISELLSANSYQQTPISKLLSARA